MRQRKFPVFLFLLLFGGVFATVGFCVAFFVGRPILNKAKASVDWPTVQGTVDSSEVVRSRDSDGDTMYSAEVVYSYTVDGRKFTCDTVWFGGDFRSSSSSSHHKTVHRYPAGRQVNVHYKPDDPTVAVLEPGTKWSSYFAWGLGWLFCTIGLLVLGGAAIRALVQLKTWATGGAGDDPYADTFDRESSP